MKTVRFCLYNFEELSEEAKKIAVKNHHDQFLKSDGVDRVEKILNDEVNFLKKYFIGDNINLSLGENEKVQEFNFQAKFTSFAIEDLKRYFSNPAINSDTKIDVSYSGNIKNGVVIKFPEISDKEEFLGLGSYCDGFILSTIKRIDSDVKSAKDYIQSENYVSTFLKYEENLWFHKDGADASPAELSMI